MSDIEIMTRKWRKWCDSHGGQIPLDRVPRLLEAILRDERERCARLAMSYGGREAEEIAEMILDRVQAS